MVTMKVVTGSISRMVENPKTIYNIIYYIYIYGDGPRTTGTDSKMMRSPRAGLAVFGGLVLPVPKQKPSMSDLLSARPKRSGIRRHLNI